VNSLFVPLFVDGHSPANIESLSCRGLPSILPSAVSSPPSIFVYSFLFVDDRSPANLESLPYRGLSSILPSAVSSPPSIFVYSFPYSLTIAPPPTSKACPAAVCRPSCRPRSPVRRPYSFIRSPIR
jgi:hypothetical protein